MGFLKKASNFAKGLSWKAWVIVVFLLLLVIVLPRIYTTFNKDNYDKPAKPVKVMTAKEESHSLTLEYLGVVEAQEMKKVGFKMAGVLDHIFVKAGQSINTGETIAQLESADLQLAASAAQNTRDNAKIAYGFARDNYEKMEKLLEAGAISAQESDKARVEMENLQANYNNAEIDYQNKLNNLEDTALQADVSGFVADVFYEEGEVIPSGYPVAVIRGEKLEINIGLSQDDLSKVSIGTSAKIIANGKDFEGKITSIGQLPDSQTRTYQTTIEIEETGLPIGMTVDVVLDIGMEKGIYIPISIIRNDYQDYVYVIEDDLIAHKRVVQLGKIDNTYVMVSGIEEGESVVTEGGKRLYEGDKVLIQQ